MNKLILPLLLLLLPSPATATAADCAEVYDRFREVPMLVCCYDGLCKSYILEN